MPPKRLLEPPASPEVKSASPKRRRRGAARGGARRGTPKRNARGLFEVGLAIEDMVRDVEAANDLFPDEPCEEASRSRASRPGVGLSRRGAAVAGSSTRGTTPGCGRAVLHSQPFCVFCDLREPAKLLQ